MIAGTPAAAAAAPSGAAAAAAAPSGSRGLGGCGRSSVARLAPGTRLQAGRGRAWPSGATREAAQRSQNAVEKIDVTAWTEPGEMLPNNCIDSIVGCASFLSYPDPQHAFRPHSSSSCRSYRTLALPHLPLKPTLWEDTRRSSVLLTAPSDSSKSLDPRLLPTAPVQERARNFERECGARHGKGREAWLAGWLGLLGLQGCKAARTQGHRTHPGCPAGPRRHDCCRPQPRW